MVAWVKHGHNGRDKNNEEREREKLRGSEKKLRIKYSGIEWQRNTMAESLKTQ